MPTGQPRTQGSSGHCRQRSASRSAISTRVADGDFLEVARALRRILLGHRRALLRDRADRLLLRHGVSRVSPVSRRRVGGPLSTARRIRPSRRAMRQPSSHFFSASCSAGRKRAEAGHEVVEVHLVRVEVGAVDARELDAVADLDAAAAAHAGAVDHHRVEAHDRADLAGPRDFGARLHHDRRADRERLVDVRVRGERLFHALGHEPLDAGGAVVGADDELVADAAELVLPEHHVAVAKAQRRRSRGRRCAHTRAPAGRPARRRGRRRRTGPSCGCRCGSGCPSGRRPRTGSCRPGSCCCISRVVLPTAWITSVIVPCSRSKSASVSGMRSPCSCSITMTNWPALRRLRHQRMADLQHVRDVGVILAADDLEIGHCVRPVSGPACRMSAAGSSRAYPALDRFRTMLLASRATRIATPDDQPSAYDRMPVATTV